MIENQDIQQVDGKTPQFRTELARQLEDLVPEAIADGKVDVAKLKEQKACYARCARSYYRHT